ncbi:MAG: hypothetical protein KC708_01755 [Anaerolineae bacterium]|nr:hypothetical protein [Anaerolineae bacterium]
MYEAQSQPATINPRSGFVWQSAAAVVLALMSFLLSAYFSHATFEQLPHLEDEMAYLYQARIFARGQLTIDIPQPSLSYWQPFLIDDTSTGQRGGKYPPGWPLLLAFGEIAGQLWIVNALLASLLTSLTFAVGRTWFDPDVGLFAALLVAFSPMVMLLNASLMAHTLALVCVMAILLLWRRLLRGSWRIALAVGLLAGLLYITRPLPTLGLGLVCSVLFLRHLYNRWRAGRLLRTLPPYVLAAVGLLLMVAFGWAYTAALTGNPTENLYVRIWTYDSLGFGECCGRSGHNLSKAVGHFQFDISVSAADLYGWQIGPIDSAMTHFWQTSGSYYPNMGLSWIALAFGLVVALWPIVRRYPLISAFWAVLTVIWLWLPGNQRGELAEEAWFSWAWVIFGIVWCCWPLLFLRGRQQRVWTVVSVAAVMLVLSMAYWTGSQRYSTRYYFEAVGAVIILSGIGLAWLAQNTHKPVIYGGLILLTAVTFFTFSIPRIDALRGFNQMTQAFIDEVNARRRSNEPLLVIVHGPGSGSQRVSWRAMGPLMAMTSPYLDSDIVLAWDFQSEGVFDRILARFPGREIIEMEAIVDEIDFYDPLADLPG